MFLTETPGWKEGLPGAKASNTKKPNMGVTLLAKYLFVTKQMGWREGLKMFQEQGEIALEKDLKQINDMDEFQPKYWFDFTEEERALALKCLMYLKKKRDGMIKGCGCANKRPQMLNTAKAESSSPMASLAGLIMAYVIDAYERHDVATLDIPGAFLQTRMPATRGTYT